jgi:hypothetical protein
MPAIASLSSTRHLPPALPFHSLWPPSPPPRPEAARGPPQPQRCCGLSFSGGGRVDLPDLRRRAVSPALPTDVVADLPSKRRRAGHFTTSPAGGGGRRAKLLPLLVCHRALVRRGRPSPARAGDGGCASTASDLHLPLRRATALRCPCLPVPPARPRRPPSTPTTARARALLAPPRLRVTHGGRREELTAAESPCLMRPANVEAFQRLQRGTRRRRCRRRPRQQQCRPRRRRRHVGSWKSEEDEMSSRG